MGLGGEIFVMDMGDPVKIVDLARDMIRLSGFNEDEIKIDVYWASARRKVFEELLADDEHTFTNTPSQTTGCQSQIGRSTSVNELVAWMKEND